MELEPIEYGVEGGYYPSTSDFPPPEFYNTMKAGQGMWVRAGNQLQVANGAAQQSATNIGARIFPYDQYRAEIAGGLVSGRLPFAGLIRFANAVMMFVSELTSQQVFINESTATPFNMTGVTTGAIAGTLRIAVPSGSAFNTFDAGFSPPILPGGNVTTPSGGTKGMVGATGVALAAWRTATNAISAPSNIVYKTLTPGSADIFNVALTAAASGQDGFIFCGTRWGDDSGKLKVVRYVYIVPRGTLTATNASPNISGDSNTRWLRDLRVGDVVTIDAASYTIVTITADNTATITPNFAGITGAGKTMTITTAVADWFDSELDDTDAPDPQAQKPPKAAGVFQFADRVFLWGVGGASGSPSGPLIYPMLDRNPEHIGLLSIKTSQNDDLVSVVAGDQTLFLMTTNTLEIVTFTNDESVYKVRAYDGVSGFMSAANGCVYKNRFYGFQQRPIRTVTDQDIDVEFAKPVWRVMQGWDPLTTVLAVDPKNEAVLYCNFVGGTTTVYPFMAQLSEAGRPVWSLPITISGQVVDYAVVGGNCYLIVLTGGNYRAFLWEGGGGATAPFVGFQYISYPDRYTLKGIVYTGRGTNLRVYKGVPGAIPQDVSITGSGEVNFTIQDTNQAQPEIFTDIGPARAFALRVDFSAVSSVLPQFQRLVARIRPHKARR